MTKPDPATVRTRFAPSPSGHLHVGGARTALFCWAYAKGRGGKFILRIEDTDVKRSSNAASMAFLEDLKWLGILWDEGPEYDGCGGGEFGPYHQSQRLEIYNRYLDQLIAGGKAYRAFETPQELDAVRDAARLEKRIHRYDRAALRLSPDVVRQYLRESRPHVIRFKVPGDLQRVVVRDEVRGEIVTERSELDDFVIRKADGYPMYNFAVVVDDELMGVTHVVRAQEHLSNTPRQILLQDALGWGGHRPAYAHLSIITNPDGSKMSKRDKDKALRSAVKQRGLKEPPRAAGGGPLIDPDRWQWWTADSDHQLDLMEAEQLAEALGVDLPEINVHDFRRHGYLPEVLVNYLGLLGWSPGGDVEKFDQPFFLKRFDFDRVVKSPAKFDREKLLAFNLDAQQAMSASEFLDRFRRHCRDFHPEFVDKLSDRQFDMLARANHARSKTLEDPIKSCRFFILPDDEIVYEHTKPAQEALLKGEPNGYAHLEALLPVLRDLADWTVEALQAAVERYAGDHAGGKLGKVAQPLRIAVSGGVVSPAIFDTLAILGKQVTLNRIQRCVALRSTVVAGSSNRV